jgi:diguanylate cyclase (GGDEF)-like protein
VPTVSWGTVLDRLERLPAAAIVAAAIALVAVIGSLDYAAGSYVSFSLFYLVPIGVAASFAGRGWGLCVATVAAVVALVGDVAAKQGTGLLPYWNAVSRFGVFVVVAIVVAQLRGAHQRERRLARIDGLTGVANYRSFEEAAEREIHIAHRYRTPLSLVFIDLDGFKAVNDTFGHAAGDDVLRAVASALCDTLRPSDLVARVGGDEFVVLMPHTAPDGAHVSIDRVVTRLEDDPRARGISFSTGVVQLEGLIGSIDDLVGKADALMYEDKVARRAADRRPAGVPG